jgi:hypothetical protein
MAKYIKTEEGYKPLSEVEGTNLIAGDYIEIKDNIIRSTLGDDIKVEKEVFYSCFSGKFGTFSPVSQPASIPEYTIEDWTAAKNFLPNKDKVYTVRIKPVSSDHFFSYSNIKVNVSTFLAGIFYRMYVGELEICWVKNSAGFVSYVSVSGTYDDYYSNAEIEILEHRTEIIDTYVKVPKAALNYDEVPTGNSDNLLTSGSIHTALEDVQSNIKSDIENGITTEYIGSSCIVGDTTVMKEGSITVSSFDNPDFKVVAGGDDILDRGATYIIHIGNTEYTGVCQVYDEVLYVGNGYLQNSIFFEDTGEPFVLYQFSIGDNTTVHLIAISTNELSEGTTYPYSIIKDERETVYKSMSPFDLIKQIEDLNNTVEALTAKIEALEENQITAVTDNEIPTNSPEGAE